MEHCKDSIKQETQRYIEKGCTTLRISIYNYKFVYWNYNFKLYQPSELYYLDSITWNLLAYL